MRSFWRKPRCLLLSVCWSRIWCRQLPIGKIACSNNRKRVLFLIIFDLEIFDWMSFRLEGMFSPGKSWLLKKSDKQNQFWIVEKKKFKKNTIYNFFYIFTNGKKSIKKKFENRTKRWRHVAASEFRHQMRSFLEVDFTKFRHQNGFKKVNNSWLAWRQ